MLIIILIYLFIALGNSMFAAIQWCIKKPDTWESDVDNINWWIVVVLYGLLWPGVWVMNAIEIFTNDT